MILRSFTSGRSSSLNKEIIISLILLFKDNLNSLSLFSIVLLEYNEIKLFIEFEIGKEINYGHF